MANVVQFVGIDNVVSAFTNRGCQSWSVWVGNQFLFSFVGTSAADAANELQTLLDTLDKSGKGIYTLKIYERINKKELITSKTPCHGSFNFKLKTFDPDTDGGKYYNDLRDEIKTLKAERETLLQELDADDEDDKPKDFIGAITEMIVTDPAKIPVIIQSLYAILNMFTGQTKQTGQQVYQPAPVALGAVAFDNGKSALQSAVDELTQYDPKLTEHLQKLVLIAKNDPPGFKSLLQILDNMG